MDRDPWRGTVAGRAVLVGLVHVEHRVEVRVERAQRGGRRAGHRRRAAACGSGRRASRACAARPPPAARRAAPAPCGRRPRAAGGARGRAAGRRRSRRRAARARAGRTRGAGTAGRSSRRTRRGRAVGNGAEPDGDALHRPEPLHRVVNGLDAGRQRREVLSRRADHHDRTVDRAGEDARRAPQERGAVPLQRRLGLAHPRRAPAHEHHACRSGDRHLRDRRRVRRGRWMSGSLMRG